MKDQQIVAMIATQLMQIDGRTVVDSSGKIVADADVELYVRLAKDILAEAYKDSWKYASE